MRGGGEGVRAPSDWNGSGAEYKHWTATEHQWILSTVTEATLRHKAHVRRQQDVCKEVARTEGWRDGGKEAEVQGQEEG